MRLGLLRVVVAAMLVAALSPSPAAAAGATLWPVKISSAPYQVCGMVMGADGTHHVILYEPSVTSTGRYATDRGGAWRVQDLPITPVTIVMDAADNPVVLGYDSAHDYLYRGDGVAPLSPIAIPAPAQWWAPSLVADIKATSDGLIHFVTNGDTLHSVAYATYDGTAWSAYAMVAPAGIPSVNRLALAIAGTGTPHVIVAGPEGDACAAAGCVADIAVTASPTASDVGIPTGGGVMAASGVGGSVEVVAQYSGVVRHASNSSGSWASETVVGYLSGVVGSLVQGPKGMVILFGDGTTVERADWSTSAWVVTPVHSGSSNAYGAVDSQNTAHVAYMVHRTGSDVADPVVAAPDKVGPVATSPIVRPRAGGIVGSTVPTTVVWRGTDNLSGWAISSLQQQRNGGTWSTIGSGLTAKSLNRALAPGLTTYALRVRGTDKAGNTGAWAAGPTVNLAVAPQTNAAIKYGGTWTSLGAASYLGGSAMTAYSTTAFATIRFTGRGFAWVGKYAASCGSAKVWVDGVLKATVSSYRTMTAYRPIIWSIAWSTSATHTIVIRPADTAGHPRIVLDGIVIVR